MELFYRNILTNCEYYGKISEQKFQTKKRDQEVKSMKKEDLRGKKYLESLLWYGTEIGEKTAELAYWQAAGVYSSGTSEADEILEREAELERLIRTLTQKKLDATRMIDEIQDPVARAVLRRRYILGDTWAKVAENCGGMSERNAHYVHDIALFDFEKIFTEE